MKWSIVGLVALGLIAAVAAGVLVVGLTSGGILHANATPGTDPDAPVSVAMASRSLPAMTMLSIESIKLQTMPRSKVPAGAMTETADLIGKILAMPVAEGQLLTKQSLASDKTPLASLLPKGKRAVGIAISNSSALDGMLSPGSTVDVLGSFHAVGNPGAADYHEARSVTLLEGVQVLAIERMTVVPHEGKTDDDSATRANPTRRVTLLVDTDQAKVLQLGMDQGSLSLSLRNPLDHDSANTNDMGLSTLLNGASSTAPSAVESSPSDHANRWETTILRGNVSERVSFPVSRAEDVH